MIDWNICISTNIPLATWGYIYHAIEAVREASFILMEPTLFRILLTISKYTYNPKY